MPDRDPPALKYFECWACGRGVLHQMEYQRLLFGDGGVIYAPLCYQPTAHVCIEALNG